MSSLPAHELPVVRRELHVPSLEELKDVLAASLRSNFAEAEVDIVDCPDLTKQPFTLAAPGLGGNATVLEVGGPPFLLPSVQRDKLYDVRPLLNRLQFGTDAFVIGAGAGPWPSQTCNCELIMNLKVSGMGVDNQSRVASVDKTSEGCVLQQLPHNETRFALLANLFASQGKPGKVLRVRAKKRTGQKDFIASMQTGIAERYKDQLVGLGGTFLMSGQGSKAKQHVMPDFSATPLNTEKQLNEWLKFYDMSTPLIAVGTFVSSESDLDLRVQHFHSFSHHGEGGHYHVDTTPETIEYLGYFNVGNTLYRVDKPEAGLAFGKD